MLFDGEIILITGAGSGVGRAAALRAAEEGAAGIACLDIHGADAVADEVRAAGGDAIGLTVDNTRASDWEAALPAVLERWGRVDALAGVAGAILDNVTDIDKVLDVSEDGWQRILDINLVGTWRGMRAVLPTMIDQGSGSIVVVTSAAANIGASRHAAYSAAKGGAQALARQAAIEYAGNGVRINSLAPGPIDSPMMADVPQATKDALGAILPLGRWAQPVEVAEAVLFLASPRASFITGACLAVDGGLSAN